MTTTVKRIEKLDRLNNSANGNPRYRVHFTDGTDAITSSDRSFCYAIANPEMRGDVEVTYTRAGRIEHIAPAPVTAMISPWDVDWLSADNAELRDLHAAIATLYQDLYDSVLAAVRHGIPTTVDDWTRTALMIARDDAADRAEKIDNRYR